MGTGFGFLMCVEIVKVYGGVFSVIDDEVLGGVCFEFWLLVLLKIKVIMNEEI